MSTKAMVRLLPFVLVISVAGYATGAMPSAAEPQASARPGDAYASIAKLPDWSGVWVIPFGVFAEEGRRQQQPGSPTGPQLTPEYAAKLAAATQRRLSSTGANGPADRPATTLCGPRGMPNVMRFSFAVEFLFTPGRVTILLELGPAIRRVFTDGRTHTSDPDLSYLGESVGRWENDTLIVDTTSISPRALLTGDVNQSGQAHIVERIRLADRTHLRIDTVVEDPIALRMPWRYSRIYERSDGSWFEQYCDNNRDGNDSEPDLTPPAK